MSEKITLEELVALRNKLEEMEEQEEIDTNYDSTLLDRKIIMKDIASRLKSSEIIKERNFDRIAVGTAFYGRFLKDDQGQFGEIARYMLVNSNNYNLNPEFLSKTSPLGQAVMGKRDNDIIFYDVVDEMGTTKSIVFYIDSIDRNYNNYVTDTNSKGRAR